ncbi:DUF6090 family protein [Flavobacteriaceae sp. LMIT009]
MIKFFRKIRQSLINQNRIRKYLIYAVGEIILVVLGILIALNLNNRNEQRKTEAKIEVIFSDIMDELVSNIDKTTQIMRYYNKRDSIIYLVLNDRFTAEDYQSNKLASSITWGLTGWHMTLNLTNSAYKNLIEDLDATPAKYKEVLKDLNHLYSSLKTVVDKNDKDMSEFIEKNSEFNRRNYSWYASNSEVDQKSRLEYLLNDFRYKNEVSGYWNKGINNQLKWSITYRQQAIKCYKKIAKLLDKPVDHESFVFDEELAKLLVGEWYRDGHPEETFTNILKNKRLYGKAGNSEWEIFSLFGNKLVDSDTDYATIVRENDEILLKYNDSDYRKKE